MKVKTKNKIVKALLGLFLIGLGIAIGIAIRHYYYIPIAETFNIVDVATLVTTIFIAVYIPSILDRQMEITKEKKELITSRVDELQILYRRINKSVQQNEINEHDRKMVMNLLDILSHRLDTITTLFSELDVKINFSKEIGSLTSLCRSYEELFRSYTDKNPGKMYTDDIRKKEEKLYNEIDKESSLLIFKLSDA